MATRYSYPVDFHEEGEGGTSVSFPDFSEAFTEGDTVALGIQESEVRRMLDPRHATQIGRLEEALTQFGKRLVITVEATA